MARVVEEEHGPKQKGHGVGVCERVVKQFRPGGACPGERERVERGRGRGGVKGDFGAVAALCTRAPHAVHPLAGEQLHARKVQFEPAPVGDAGHGAAQVHVVRFGVSVDEFGDAGGVLPCRGFGFCRRFVQPAQRGLPRTRPSRARGHDTDY